MKWKTRICTRNKISRANVRLVSEKDKEDPPWMQEFLIFFSFLCCFVPLIERSPSVDVYYEKRETAAQTRTRQYE